MGKKLNQGRELAVETYLPNWEGFRASEPRKEGVFGHMQVETMEVSKALEQAEQVWNCLTECQLKDATSGATAQWDSPGFDLQKVSVLTIAEVN